MNTNEFTLETMGQWPMPIKLSVMLGVSFLISVLGYWLLLKSNVEQFATLYNKETILKHELETKQHQALNLQVYRNQLQQMKDRFAVLLNRKKHPLEAFSLETLKFVGTLKEGDSVWALIQKPDLQITQIRVGQFMGLDYGRVISIKDTAITLEETVKHAGKWKKQETFIKLHTGLGK